MNRLEKKTKWIIVIIVCSVIFVCCYGFIEYNRQQKVERLAQEQYELSEQRLYEQEAAINEKYMFELEQAKFSAIQFYKEEKGLWGEYFTDDQIQQLEEIGIIINDSQDINEIGETVNQINEIVEAAKAEKERLEEETRLAEEARIAEEATAAAKAQASQEESNTINYGSMPDLRTAGVVYYNGWKFTWYSSNALYHYKTSEWRANDLGFWCDSNGYIILASSDLSFGTTVDTPWGVGIVQDSGCASGTLDCYVCW